MSAGIEQTDKPIGDLEQLKQEPAGPDLPMPAVPVCVNAPVQVHLLPTVTGATRNYAVTVDAPINVAKEDPRRAYLTVWSTDNPFYLGFDQNQVAANYSAIVPANTPIVVRVREQVWVKSAHASDNATVSAIPEQWAE